MNNIDFIRRIDDLGRIVIPKELRRILKLNNNESIKLFVEDDKIVLKKYMYIDEILRNIKILGDSFVKIYNKNIIITDREKVIYSNKNIKNEISEELKESIINCKYLNNNKQIKVNEDMIINNNYIYDLLIINGDVSGVIIIYSDDEIKEEDIKNMNYLKEVIHNYYLTN